jgi:FkbM family methyltransferase
MQPFVLPNGISVQSSNARETNHLYQDIFERQVYFKHGIALREHSVVIDAGANIGLFTLFVLAQCPTATVHAFEPAPKTFEVLKANTNAHKNVKANNCGLGAQMKQEQFLYLPTASTGSGYYGQDSIPKIKQRICSAIMADREKSIPFKGPNGPELLRAQLDNVFDRGHIFPMLIRPLGDYIDEKKLDRIDLLKIDVEGMERAVMAGIREDQWSLINQVVIEVHALHSETHPVPGIVAALQAYGFMVSSSPEEGTLTSIVYAKRA